MQGANSRLAATGLRLEIDAVEVSQSSHPGLPPLDELERTHPTADQDLVLGFVAGGEASDLESLVKAKRFGRHALVRLAPRTLLDARAIVHAIGHLAGAVHTRKRGAMSPALTDLWPEDREFDRGNRMIVRIWLAAFHSAPGSPDRVAGCRQLRRLLEAVDEPGWDSTDRQNVVAELASFAAHDRALASPPSEDPGEAPMERPEGEPDIVIIRREREPRHQLRPILGPMLFAGNALDDRVATGARVEIAGVSTRGLGLGAYGIYMRGNALGTLAGGGLTLHFFTGGEADGEDVRGVLALSAGGFSTLREHGPDARGLSGSLFAGFRSLSTYSFAGGLRSEVRVTLDPAPRPEVVLTLELDPVAVVVALIYLFGPSSASLLHCR